MSSVYITEDGKNNNLETVRAQSDSEQSCACSCATQLQDYVLSVDFVNALQNIRAMINDSINNVDVGPIYRKLIQDIRDRLENVWKHIGLESFETKQEAEAFLQTLSPRIGDTRVLSYKKSVTVNSGTSSETTVQKQVNDLCVYVDQFSSASGRNQPKWIKLMTLDFDNDSDSDSDLTNDQIIERLQQLEDDMSHLSNIVTSIWAYLCKDWWEVAEIKDSASELPRSANVGQTHYVKNNNSTNKDDGTIYVYLQVDTIQGNPEYAWIPLLNANVVKDISNSWRHTSVVGAGADFTNIPGTFIGETKLWLRDNNIYVWLPTSTDPEPNNAKQWVPLLTAVNRHGWTHTKTITSHPTEDGSFIGETRVSTESDDNENFNGDVFVWLPSNTGGENGVGSQPHWVNITRNKTINNIKNYIPDYAKYTFTSDDVIQPNIKKLLDKEFLKFTGTIERNGLMVNLSLSYGRKSATKYEGYDGNKFLDVVNYKTGGAAMYWNDYLKYFLAVLPFGEISYEKFRLLGKITDEQKKSLTTIVNIKNIRSYTDQAGNTHDITSNEAEKLFCPSIFQKTQCGFSTLLFKSVNYEGTANGTFVTNLNLSNSTFTRTTLREQYFFPSWGANWAELVNVATHNNITNIPDAYNSFSNNPFYNKIKDFIEYNDNNVGYYRQPIEWAEGQTVLGKGGSISSQSIIVNTDGIVQFTDSVQDPFIDQYWMRKYYALDFNMSWPGQPIQ